MAVDTILIVDDNEVDRFLHEAVIHSVSPDITVLQACDGEHALQILSESSPDLIFLDVNMPQMNGLAFLKELGNNQKNPSVYMLSSTYRDCDQQEALRHDFVKDCLLKPLSPEMVEGLIKT